MLSSYTVNIAYHANNPDVGMALEKDAGRYKLFNSDVGLFITWHLRIKNILTENWMRSATDLKNISHPRESAVKMLFHSDPPL